MNRNKLFTFVAAALLTLGGASMLTAATYAKSPNTQVVQAQPAISSDCSQDQADGTEAVETADNDTIDLQCGDQNATDSVSEVNVGLDTDSAQDGSGDQVEDSKPETPDAAGSVVPAASGIENLNK